MSKWFWHYRWFNFCHLFSTFELEPFLGLNTIKMHYRGYLVCAGPTVLYWSIWNFVCPFVIVCRCAFGFGIVVNLILSLFRLLNSSLFWGLNTIKMYHRGYLLCATPPTVLYWSVWNFAGTFVMVCRCACCFGIILFPDLFSCVVFSCSDVSIAVAFNYWPLFWC